MRQRRAGMALGTVLMCLSVLVALLFIAVSASLSHLNLVNHLGQRDHATNLAESALSRAMEELISSDFTFGKVPGSQVTVNHSSELEGAEGFLSFDPGFPGHSTYNLDSDTSTLGSGGTTVPPHSVHLVARGRFGEVERWMECIYHQPPYPDGLVASGPIEASGLVLTGVKSGGDYSGGNPNDLPEEQKVLANLFSNAKAGKDGKPAILLGENCDIHGSVGAEGAIIVNPASKVRGEILPQSDPRPLPQIQIGDRIEVLKKNAIDRYSTGGSLTLDKNWFNHSEGGLNVGGDVILNGSVLTVNGPLTIGGSLKGMGAILVDGSVTILDGGTTVETTDQVAIACTGDVEISSESPESNYFQGLVYSEGNLKAKNITVVGAVIVNGDSGEGHVELDNVRFVRSPSSVNISLQAMKGYSVKGGDRALGLSFTLVPAADGETYLCSARAVFTLKSGIKGEKLNTPINWTSDKVVKKEWLDSNIGKPGDANFGKSLSLEIAQWAADVDSGYEKKVERQLRTTLADEATKLLNSPSEGFNMTFSLNNLLAEQLGKSRILLWRPVEDGANRPFNN